MAPEQQVVLQEVVDVGGDGAARREEGDGCVGEAYGAQAVPERRDERVGARDVHGELGGGWGCEEPFFVGVEEGDQRVFLGSRRRRLLFLFLLLLLRHTTTPRRRSPLQHGLAQALEGFLAALGGGAAARVDLARDAAGVGHEAREGEHDKGRELAADEQDERKGRQAADVVGPAAAQEEGGAVVGGVLDEERAGDEETPLRGWAGWRLEGPD